ncbi:MAG: ribonuclease P protein component [bacterium]
MKKYSFKRKERLRKTQEFKRVIGRGRLLFGKYITMQFVENNFSYSRWAVIIGKHIGNAVCRNRLKRRIKEIIRLNKNNAGKNFDVIFICKKGMEKFSYEELTKIIWDLIKKIPE